MKFFKVTFILYSLTLIMSCQNKQTRKILHPIVEKDTYFGTIVEDEYQYIEDNTNTEVLDWIDKQNNLTQNNLSLIDSKNRLIDIQKELDKNNTYTIKKLHVTSNNYYFYLKRFSEENVGKLYYRKQFKGEEQLLYDPNDYKKDAEYVINHFQPSWSGEKIVLSLTSSGKEISELIVLDVNTKTIAPVVLKNAWPRAAGNIQWLPDESGFTFTFFPVLDKESKYFKKNSEIVVYKIGSNNNKTTTIFSKKNNKKIALKEDDVPKISIGSKDDKYALINLQSGSTYLDTYYTSVEEIYNKDSWKPLFESSDQVKGYILKGDSLIYSTSKNAPNFKICTTSLINPNFDDPKVLIEEKPDQTITDFTITKNGLFYVLSKNGVSASLHHRDNQGSINKISLPQSYGNIDLYNQGYNQSKLWFYTWGWVTPRTRFEYENNALDIKNLSPNTTPKDLQDVIVEEIEVKGHDGIIIPLSLIYKKGIKLDGSGRVMLDGYGAYGQSLDPFFALRRMLWVYEGGIYAVAHVRGGGEKGDDWHKGGLKANKPNTWKDFISCAEFLLEKKYTITDKLAVWSGSAGGILIGRAITERPDLFKAAIVEFGVLNILRYEQIKGSANQKKEFGTTKDSLGFRTILEMDAFHHLKKDTEYPATFLTHGLNDPRLPAWQTLKFAAKIQSYNTSENPNLILIYKNTGHATDDTKTKEFERYANIMTFALWQTGHADYQPKN